VLTSDVPTSETLAFIEPHLPPGPARVLEVGCGDGALAARLQSAGHAVVALDADAGAVERARRRGVDARVGRWPDFDDAPFDVVLFTRSLHHITPLAPAVDRARQLLRGRGKVLVEDFAFDKIEPLAAEWFYQLLAVLDAAGLLRRGGHEFGEKLLQQAGSLEAWHTDHGHELHTAAALFDCLREHFPRAEMAAAPYLYRYVCAMLDEDERGYAVALRVLELEKRFASGGRCSLIGRRLVGALEGAG
jgi:SAM-dependent methyltransferase